MTDSSSVAVKKAARTFNLQDMMEQARLGAQERSKIDWTSEIEKTKDENESRIAEMQSKANEAAKQIHLSKDDIGENSKDKHDDDDDDDEDFGPRLDLATAPTANDDDDNDDTSSDDEEKDPSKVNKTDSCFMHAWTIIVVVKVNLDNVMYVCISTEV